MNAPIVSFDDSAVVKVKALIEEEGNSNLKLRIFVEGGGCSGFQYGFIFDEVQNPDDMVFVKGGQTFLIDAISMQYLNGSTVIYVESLQGSRFIIDNPNVNVSCGCGASFTV